MWGRRASLVRAHAKSEKKSGSGLSVHSVSGYKDVAVVILVISALVCLLRHTMTAGHS